MANTIPVDSYRHQGLRKLLVQNIRQKGISDPQVLAAIEKVPRHFFFDSSFLEYAYEDKPFSIGAGQTISQPYTVAFQSELLQIRKNDKVLEIGTGSGYQACILAELGAKVFTIERQKSLFDRTSKFLPLLGYHTIKTFFGDGYKGLPTFAPFDKVIVTAAAPFIPDALLEQLKPGGILVIPVGAGDIQTMTTITRNADNSTEKREYGAFRFVPMLENKAKEH
ncbi:MAG: protein-L-isoaspartate(D-aspartate) O-methyltransferase [Bacteroidota bacterium]